MSDRLPSEEFTSEDDASLGGLLREVGRRDEPTADVREEVYRAARLEWFALVERRTKRRRLFAYGGLGAFACGVLAAVFVVKLPAPEPIDALVTRIDGNVTVLEKGRQRPLLLHDRIASGDSVRTEKGRVAFDLGGGLATRFDQGSTIEFANGRKVILREGGIYVEAISTGRDPAELLVETSVGTVRHLGTRYQVRTEAGGMDVSVREGRVEIANDHGKNVGVSGERIRVSEGGSVIRSQIDSQDSSWRWATSIAPTFQIENRPLQEFLDWIARETGKTVRYADAETQQIAARVILHGSIEGLELGTALNAVLLSTPLRVVESDDGIIHIAHTR